MTNSTEEFTTHHRPIRIDVTVNHTPVTLPKDRVNGLEIKEAAIRAGVPIDVSFKLSLQVKKGVWQILGDQEETDVVEHSIFRAVASDDNS